MQKYILYSSQIQEETMEMIKEAIEHMWKDHRKVVIGAGVVLVILIIAAL